MSLEAYGDEGDVGDCDGCVELDDLRDAVIEIAAATVYEGGKKENGVSTDLIGAILRARALVGGE